MTSKSKKGQARRKALKADYQGATAEDVARALHRYRPEKRPRGVREGPPKYRRPESDEESGRQPRSKKGDDD